MGYHGRSGGGIMIPGIVSSIGPLDFLQAPDTTIVAAYRAEDFFIDGFGSTATWPDRSGNGHALTQGTASNHPQVISDGGADFNNQPVVRFDGIDNYLTSSTPTIVQPFTIITISKLTQATTGVQVLVGANTSSGNMTGADSSELPFINSGSGTTITGTTTLTNIVYLQESLHRGATSAILLDGLSEASGNADTTNQVGINVGTRWNIVNFWGGDVAEIIVVDGVVTAQARSYLNDYVAQRYGI